MRPSISIWTLKFQAAANSSPKLNNTFSIGMTGLFVKNNSFDWWSYMYYKIPKIAKPKFLSDRFKKFCNVTNRTFLQAET